MEAYAISVDAAVNEREYTSALRMTAAVACGIVSGMLLPHSLQVGFRFFFSAEPEWSLLLWGEHWVVRVAASLIAAVMAGSIAGAVARNRGVLVGAIVSAPASLIWLFVAISGWRGAVVFLTEPVYISIGNKLAASIMTLLVVPAARSGGGIGEEFGRRYGEHFDSRRGTLLGINWYHYLWLPIPIHMVLAQAAWAGLYGFEWLKLSWRAGPSFGMFIPTTFMLMVWGTFILLGTGVARAYQILSRIEPLNSARARTGAVLKYGVGFPILAWILQAAIMALHYGFARLIN